MFATVELRAELKPDALLVPDTAVLRSGEKNTVFVALDGGHFEPREVLLGARGDNDDYEVLSGLREGERVVTSGQFMLDSESQLREAIQKMLKPVAPAVPAQASAQTANANVPMQPAPDSKTGPQEYVCPTEYACPMPDHMSIKYNHSGKCPICGMTLIPAPAAGVTPTPSPTATAPEHQH